MALTWFFEQCPRLSPRTWFPYCGNLACVMKRSDSSSDFPPSNMRYHILGNLDDRQMGLVWADLVMMAHKWVENTHARNNTSGIIIHPIRDVAVVGNQTPCIDEMQLPPSLTQFPKLLMSPSIWLWHHLLGFYGIRFWTFGVLVMVWLDHGWGDTPFPFNPPWMMPCSLGRPSSSLGRLDVTTCVALMMYFLHFSIFFIFHFLIEFWLVMWTKHLV